LTLKWAVDKSHLAIGGWTHGVSHLAIGGWTHGVGVDT